MAKKINLYNLSDGKTREVIRYIERYVYEPENIVNFDTNKFERLKRESLEKKTPNDMLDHIGFRFDNEDKIYDWCVIKK